MEQRNKLQPARRTNTFTKINSFEILIVFLFDNYLLKTDQRSFGFILCSNTTWSNASLECCNYPSASPKVFNGM